MMEEKHNPVVMPQKPAVGEIGKQAKMQKKGKKLSKKTYLLIMGAGIVIVALITVVVLLCIPKGTSEEGVSPDVLLETITTEEENELTKQVLDKYVEADIQGYQRMDNEDGLNDVVVISIKNISDERTNLALDVVALDDNENVLDKTSLYAEGIEPGQTQVFQAFALSELTPEQLKVAHYKIYRANTYQLDVPQEETQTQTQEEENKVEEAE